VGCGTARDTDGILTELRTFALMHSYAPIWLIIALPSHVTAGGITRDGWAGGVAGLLDLTGICPAKGRPGHV
jgi:hypothetical protein